MAALVLLLMIVMIGVIVGGTAELVRRHREGTHLFDAMRSFSVLERTHVRPQAWRREGLRRAA